MKKLALFVLCFLGVSVAMAPPGQAPAPPSSGLEQLARRTEVAEERQFPGLLAFTFVAAPSGSTAAIRRGRWRSAGYGAAGLARGRAVGARHLRHWQPGIPLHYPHAVRPRHAECFVDEPGEVRTAQGRGPSLLRSDGTGEESPGGVCHLGRLPAARDPRRPHGRRAGLAFRKITAPAPRRELV